MYVSFQTIRKLARPTPEWGPALEQHRTNLAVEAKIPLHEVPATTTCVVEDEHAVQSSLLNEQAQTDAQI